MQVIKRDGRVVNFNQERIVKAITMAMAQTTGGVDIDLANKIANAVERQLEDKNQASVYEIQDLVEKRLMASSRKEVAQSYITYRYNRDVARKSRTKDIFLDIIGAKANDITRENANMNADTPAGMMMKFASETTKPFVDDFLLSPEVRKASQEGYIHIHDKDYYPTKSLTCLQHPLDKILKNGFRAGHGSSRPAKRIETASIIGCISMETIQNEMHGGQAIPAFDYYLAPYVKSTFVEEIKKLENAFGKDFSNLYEYQVEDYIKKDLTGLEGEKRIIQVAINNTVDRVHQSMEAFIHNLNTMHSRAGAQVPFSSVNFGTDTSEEGRMVVKNYLLATEAGLGHGETPIFPISIFKVKEGVNYFKEDKNYDLFRLACRVSAKRLFPNFSFIDAPYNKKYYVEGDYNTEVGYMGCRTRVLANVCGPSITPGRGNLSFTSINLPRLGIKYGIALGERDKADMKAFYKELDETMDLVKGQLLQRFECQCSKSKANFKFLLGSGVWLNSEKLENNSKLRTVLKHGTLSIGFIGLAETLKALIGEHHGESEKAQKLGLEIIGHMRKKCDEYTKEYNLNFTCLATPAEGLSGRFVAIDRSIYGKIKGVTDRDYYTNSFHVPVYYKTSVKHKLEVEGKYHELTNAGHISYIELDGDTVNNVDAFEAVVRIMHDCGIGYGAINHPVDRDPVCGYVGVIKDVCPRCGRHEGEGVEMEKVTCFDCNGR